MVRNAPSRDGWWTHERAQTAQDFAIGISIFLLVVGTVFAFFPTLFTPYGEAIQDEDTDAQAERIATLVVDGTEDPNTLQEGSDWFDYDGEEFQEEAGLASTSQVNVTVTPMDPDDDDPIDTGSGRLMSGHEYQGQDASSVARVVRVVDAGGDPVDPDEPAYRLTVRVW